MLDKLGDARNGHRDVVLDVEAFLDLCERNAFADMPEVVGLAQVLGHDGVQDDFLLECGFHQRLKAAAGMFFRFAVGVFQHDGVGEGGVVDKGHAQLGHVLVHQGQRKAVHHLEAGQARAQVLVGQRQQAHGGIERRQSRPGGELARRHRVDLHRCGGDHAQGAFAADEEVAQVVAGVVLAQALEAVPDLALRIDDFEAQAELAGIAIAHDLGAAGIGAQVAADGAAAFGRQRQREQVALAFAALLQGLQNAAGLDRDGEVVLVDRTDGLHAAQVQHHLLARGVGRGAHDQAGVAALGHDGGAVGRTGLDDGRHLLGRGRAYHRQRLAVDAAAPVLFVGAQVALGKHMGIAHYLAQARYQVGHWRSQQMKRKRI